MSRAFRIKIRGVFKDLTDEQRADLLAAAAEHDALTAAFTPQGHLSYDITARPFFTFRFADSGESDEDLAAAAARGEAAVRGWLGERGLAFELTGTQAEDLSQAPLAKRQKRAQA